MTARIVEQEASSRSASDTDVRILRRVHIPDGATGRGGEVVAGVGVVVDVETTGTDPDRDVVIELAARRFAYDAAGIVTRVDRPYVWREDPGRPLSDRIVEITGLTDADLEGCRIDDATAERVIGRPDVRIAHNAAFDRPFIEDRLPALSGLPWACSIEDVGWTRRGFESAKLGWILVEAGWFHDRHRAQADVDATIEILRHEVEPGRTALAILLDSAAQPGWIVRAFGSAFETRGVLRERGYRWDPVQRVWWRETRDREEELRWLEENVYAGRCCPAGFEAVDWTTRYGRG